jgi:type I restriction enzyme M protein
MLQNNASLRSLIDKLWNSLWSGGIANPLTAIEQISYLIFMKKLDDNEKSAERKVSAGLFEESDLQFRFKGKWTPPGAKEEDAIDKRELRWSNFTHKPSDEMLLLIQTKVFPFLKNLDKIAQKEKEEELKKQGKELPTDDIIKENPFTRSMANAVFIMPKASLLFEATQIIEDIFKEIERDASEGGQSFQDIQGDVYEMLLNEIATAGKMGQFRTPRHIIKLMAELVEPKLGQRVADPACGTGGFLLGAYQYILTDLVRQKSPSMLLKDEDGFEVGTMSAALTPEVKEILDNSFFGYDIDQSMVRLGLMNLMMHGIDEPQIDYRDTLGKNFDEDNTYQIIMANPPFTGKLDKSDLFDNRRTTTTKTELLFVERIFNMLTMGGTAAIIVPQGVLFGTGKDFVAIRKMLVEEAELKAVITMPGGVFKPYAGVATAILLFTKAGETNHTWFYNMDNDGYSLDDKRNKIETTDIHDIINQFRNRNPDVKPNRSGKFFFVKRAEIEENGFELSYNKYFEEIYKEVSYDKPIDILTNLKSLENKIQTGIDELNHVIEEI